MRNVAVIGTGQTRYGRRRDVDLAEMVLEAVRSALKEANISRTEVGAVILGFPPDAFEGFNGQENWCAGVAAAINKPYMRINTGGSSGSTAFTVGYNHVASGLFDCVLVVCAHRVSDTPATQYLFNTIFDPIYERQFALNTISMWALAAQQHMANYGTTEEQMAQVSVSCHENALNNPYAHIRKKVTVDEVMKSKVLSWPLKLLDSCPRSDGASAVVLASGDKARSGSDNLAWICGFGSSSDGYFLGDREEICYRQHLAIAARAAYKMAKIENPKKEIQVAELANPFTIAELMAIEAVGFCKKGQSGKFIDEGIALLRGELPINPSGSTLCSNPIGVGALTRIVEAAMQVMGKCDRRQVANVETALAETSGGAIQFGTVAILGKEKRFH